MRLKAMEKLRESQKRKDSNEEARPKKSGNGIGDAVSYLQRSQSKINFKERGNRTEKARGRKKCPFV